MASIHLHPTPVAFPFCRPDELEVVQRQLANLITACKHRHGDARGRAIFTEAAITMIARQAGDTGDMAAARQVCEVLFEQAFAFEENPLPGGAA